MSRSFVAMLEQAADLAEQQARCLHESHTVRGRWPKSEAAIKAECQELRTFARDLRRAAKYHRPNPLGGPARTFDACADAIRAGDPIPMAMREFGLKWAR